MIIWDDSKRKVAAQLSVLTSVRGVRISRTHIVVALLNSIRVYHFLSTPELYQAYETASNPYGLCCLGASTLLFPGRTAGQVQVVELNTGNVSIIPAHSGALRALALSRDEEVIATASETVGLRLLSYGFESSQAHVNAGYIGSGVCNKQLCKDSRTPAGCGSRQYLLRFHCPFGPAPGCYIR